jgi:hypothetical protein
MTIFGEPLVDPALIAAKVIRTLRRQQRDGRPDWTQALKDVLCAFAIRRDCDVYPDTHAKRGEWLLDLVWYNRKKGTIHLAVESEWGDKQCVLDDFEKLLCIKAPLKIMVYYAYHGSFLGEFEHYLMAFDHHVQGEKYLLIEMAPGPSDRAYLYEVRGNGHIRNVKFAPLILGRATAA